MIADGQERVLADARMRADDNGAEASEFLSYLTPHEDKERKNLVGKLIKQATLLGSKWEVLDLVLKKGRFTYRGKRYTDLGVTSRKKIKDILFHVGAQLLNIDDDALFSDIVNGPIGPSGTTVSPQRRADTMDRNFAEEDASTRIT